MKKQQVKELIRRTLTSILAPKGFKKGEDGFVREFQGGTQRIGVALYDFDPEFEFSLNFSIRLDEADELMHRFSGSPPKYHSETYTASILLDYFTGGTPSQFTVNTESEIMTKVNGLAPLLQNRIIPMLDQLMDAGALSRAINHDAIDKSNHPYRGMAGIILARLAGDADFEQLVARYDGEMSRMPLAEREKFRKLADYLRTNR